jgi:hypothetical protein
MYRETHAPFTLETLLHDPLTQLMMQSDNVSEAEFRTLLTQARHWAIEPAMHITL